MNELIQRAPYPVHVLPSMLINFAQQVVAATQSSYEMVVPVMLAGMSAAVQGVADVKTPYGEVMPVSLFSCVIAKSGDRKSSVLKKVMQGFKDFERGRFSECLMPGFEELKSHQFLIEDATNKGVTDIFKGGAYSLFYSLDEAALLFKNLDMPSLCKRFDGSPINEVSRTQGVTFLHDRRVALCMLTQDVTFERFLSKKGELLVESGLMPRMLISSASMQSNAGRWISAPHSEESLDSHAFHKRVQELMIAYSKSIGSAEVHRHQIGFSPQVALVWERYTNQIESLIIPGSAWDDIRAFMRRSAELVCRVAAVLHYFSGPTLDGIKPWEVESAIQIVIWHLHEAKRIFGEEAEDIKFKRNVDDFYKYLLRKSYKTGDKVFSRSEILRCAPANMRSANSLDAAIAVLMREGKVFESVAGRKRFFLLAGKNFDFSKKTRDSNLFYLG